MSEFVFDPEKYPSIAALMDKGKEEDGGDGSGVREPRRPKPKPPAISEELELV